MGKLGLDFTRDLSSWTDLAGNRLALFVIALLVLSLLASAAARVQRRRQVQTLYAALADSAAAHLTVRGRLNAQGFTAAYEPAPQPFRKLSVSVSTHSRQNAASLFSGRITGRRNLLTFGGVLLRPPGSEIIWVRNMPPLNALGANPGSAVWTSRQLDFVPIEFATRGANPGALCHELQNLQTRFGPALLRVSVQQERTPHLEVEALSTAVDIGEIGPLYEAVRALGRAALIG